MTNSEMIEKLETDGLSSVSDMDFITNALQKNDKLKAEIEQLKSELEQLVKFKEYFMELYNQGLEVSNWHLNGDLEPLTNFIDFALEEA